MPMPIGNKPSISDELDSFGPPTCPTPRRRGPHEMDVSDAANRLVEAQQKVAEEWEWLAQMLIKNDASPHDVYLAMRQFHNANRTIEKIARRWSEPSR